MREGAEISEKVQKIAKRKTSMHMLNRLIKQGYSECGTDADVDGADVWGDWWWPIVRDAVLWRDDGRCMICADRGTAVHHILPRCRGGSDNPVNLVTVCERCHRMIHKKRGLESVDAVRKYIRNQTTLEIYIEVTV